MEPILNNYQLGPDVVAFSTTRQGGCSTGNYAAFNINAYCGDDELHIQENRQSLCQLLGIKENCLLMPHQVHLDRIAKIDETLLALEAEERKAALEGFDALMTNLRGVCIGVSTADCIPILLYDEQHGAIAAVHAGWRGTVQRIAEKAVRAMSETYGSTPSMIKAVIGPGISLDSFEVGDEVYEAFSEAGFDMPSISQRREKWHIDLFACNRLQLIAAGLPSENIHVDGTCTYQHPNRYFSARRLGIKSGRIFTGALLKESMTYLNQFHKEASERKMQKIEESKKSPMNSVDAANYIVKK